jgi:MFS family permease
MTGLTLLDAGVVKACSNLTVGMLADRFGRRALHITGWTLGFALPLMVIFSKNWGTVVAANVFLGAQQGMAWSSAIFM